MAKEPFPQDRGWAWAIVVGSFFSFFFMVGTAKSLGLFLSEFQQYFGCSTSMAAMVMGSGAIVYAVLSPVCIMLGQRFQVRRVIMIFVFIAVIGMASGSLLISIEYLIATFGLCFGIGNSAIYGNCLVMLGVYFRKRKTLANGLALAGSSIGQFALPPVIEYLLETYSLHGSILLLSGLYFNVFAAASLFRPPSFYASIYESKEVSIDDRNTNTMKVPLENGLSNHDSENGIHDTKSPDDQILSPLVPSVGDKDVTASEESELKERENEYLSLMTSTGSLCMQPVSAEGLSRLCEDKKPEKSICQELVSFLDFAVMKSYVSVFITVISFLCFFGYFNFILFLPSHVLSQGITKYEKAILISMCGAGDLVGRVTMALIGDHNFLARYKMKAIGVIAAGVSMGSLVSANNFWWFAVPCGLYGFFGGIYVSLVAVVLIDMVGVEKMPRLLAMVILIQGFGSAVGQPFAWGCSRCNRLIWSRDGDLLCQQPPWWQLSFLVSLGGTSRGTETKKVGIVEQGRESITFYIAVHFVH
ncbi:monocarboxylate transporter 12-like isoform X2 [Pomacea canaliculata]|nr:monocarboxylate transporter 12-like isoform X2 [Pomacea canaliculata]XP_025078865.1 monocarboxylate transporter 12-like isoform X2 [Pomacea canaliculata]XP_025078866.1 monocarboxylate transporter 12-like isoform X2 [Pomacea canaliculata]